MKSVFQIRRGVYRVARCGCGAAPQPFGAAPLAARRCHRGSPASNSGQPRRQPRPNSRQPRVEFGAAPRCHRGSPASNSGLPRAALGAAPLVATGGAIRGAPRERRGASRTRREKKIAPPSAAGGARRHSAARWRRPGGALAALWRRVATRYSRCRGGGAERRHAPPTRRQRAANVPPTRRQRVANAPPSAAERRATRRHAARTRRDAPRTRRDAPRSRREGPATKRPSTRLSYRGGHTLMSLPAERPLVRRSRPAWARWSLAVAGPCPKRSPSRRAIGLLRAASSRR